MIDGAEMTGREPVRAVGLLTGRRFLVTGGARGIGAAVVHLLSEHGAHGAVIDLGEPETAGPWPARSADVADEHAMRAAVADLVAQNGPFDGLVAAAGVVPSWHSPEDIDLDDFDRVQRVNTRGIVVSLKTVVPGMPDGSTVVAIGSLNSWKGDAHLLSYVASKHAVLGIVRSAALALGSRGIRVNAVAPGPVATEALLSRIDSRVDATGRTRDEALASSASATALQRLATPDDVAGAVLFLSSPLAAAITGHLLPVDGGLS
ncbi:Acetoacetyl-CoA reductase [Microbacterium lemovicicum]|uniref:Acetoacetyl-CoA reductase n=1 Tax=Microbacterium lemovicicum TaxID=1072463 RepID=A0A3S9WCJ9_9MICO|nr:SDR family oxidoreductase [Microbacterium lemovicicum]AZS37815.1 Acetoacetyl-CoA reductase [Microbacterium lemovicicum]